MCSYFAAKKKKCFASGPKNLIIVSFDQSTFVQVFAITPIWFVANFMLDLFWQSFNSSIYTEIKLHADGLSLITSKNSW